MPIARYIAFKPAGKFNKEILTRTYEILKLLSDEQIGPLMIVGDYLLLTNTDYRNKEQEDIYFKGFDPSKIIPVSKLESLAKEMNLELGTIQIRE